MRLAVAAASVPRQATAFVSIAMFPDMVAFSQIFGHFMQAEAALRPPDVAYLVAAAVLALALVMFLALTRQPEV